MQKPIEPKILLDEDGIQITTRKVTTAAGDFAIKDIEAVERRIRKPVWGPLFLGILGTLNLVIAYQSDFWFDFAAAGVMLGGGLYWWTSGTRYVLTLKMPDGDVDAWFARRQSRLQDVLNVVQQRLDKRRAGAGD